MSHLTTELCEKYPGERIQQWEYQFEAREWAAVGFLPTAFADGASHRLPRNCYFSNTGTKDDVLRAWARISSRLGRKVRLECTIGPSFGKDLALTNLAPPANATPPAAQAVDIPVSRPAMSFDELLSAAFNKVFRPSFDNGATGKYPT